MKRLIIILAIGVALLPFATQAHAVDELLEGVKVEMADSRDQVTTTHTYYFTKDIGSIARMDFQYCVNPSAPCTTSTGADGASASKPGTSAIVFGGGTDETADWVFTFVDATDTFRYTHTGAGGANGSGEYVVAVQNLANADFSACTNDPPGNSSTGTCYVWFSTYSDSAGATPDDTAVASVTITRAINVSARVDPSFQFTVTGVAATGERHSTTITTDVTTTITTLPFGNLTANTERYAAHDLQIISNTDGGYVVTASLVANMTGVAYDVEIDPFSSATDNAAVWSQPTGTVAGTDTGWIGIGTDDTDVTGAAEAEFFPLGTHNQQVALSTVSTVDDDIEVIYAMEVNSSHPADNYVGILYFNATPTY
ncbi:hypothetical protein ACFL1M_04250 [Patescibacteria group bacterium]